MKRSWILLLAVCMLFTGCGRKEDKIRSLDDLEGKTIGVQMKTTGDIYASDIKNAKTKQFNKGIDAVKALRKGVVDAVMIDDAPAKVFAAQYSDVKILEEPYAKEEYGIAVNKEETGLRDKINEALEKLEQNGTLASIRQAWLQEGEQKTAYQWQKKKHSGGKLVMVTNAEFPPYESKDNKGNVVGIDVDIMKAICDMLDMDLEINDTAFDSILANVERKMADVGVAGMTITEERRKQVDFTDPYTTAKQVVLVRK